MKKLLFALLMAALLVALFVACTEPEITTPDVTTTTPADSTTPDAAVTTTDGVVTTTTNPDTTTTPADSTTAAPDTTEEPQGPVTPTEKTLVLGPKDFSNCTAIAMNGVVPNTDHPNEFTFSKNGACMASGITGVTKVVAHVFGTYDNLKMYKGLSTDGTEIKATVANKDLNKEYTYTFEGSTDEFFLINPSTYQVHLYSITIYYTGTIGDTAPTLPENPGTPDTPDTPVAPSGAISIEEAINIAKGLSEERGTTDATYTITGVVTSVGSQEITLTQNGKSIVCYMGTGAYSNLYMGYTLTLTGKLQNYYGTPELVYFTVNSYEAVKYTVSITLPENGTVSATKTADIAWGENVTITATPDNGYLLNALKVNGLKVNLTDGKYTVKVTEPLTVEASFVKEGAVSETLAKFDFGANGAAEHKDGSAVSGTKTYTEGNYSLTISNLAGIYGGAFDATGISCLKVGTSKASGSFTFTVPEDVKTVVLYIAGYKAKTSKITVNGGAQMPITTSSNNGSYTAIEIDTSSVKTVTIATVTGASRVMIDAIEFKN